MVIKSGYNTVNGDYVFTQIAEEVQKYRAKNKGEVIDLGVGDVKLPPPKITVNAMRRAVENFDGVGFKGYPPDYGYPFLRQAICARYKKLGQEIFEDEVFITEGAKNAIGNILEIARFSRAMIPIPTYPLYRELCKAHLIKTKLIKGLESDNFLAHPDFSCDCDLIFLCSPCNPTGAVIGEQLLQEYVDYAEQKNAVIILDGAYSAFYNYFPPQKLAGASRRVIEVKSYSKSLSFTGLRCGYVVIKREHLLYNAYKKRESLRTNGVNYFAQVGALTAYTKEGESAVNERIAHYIDNANILKRPFLNAGITVLGGQNAPYLFCKINKNGYEAFKEILNSVGVAVTPGEGFNAKGFIRISCLVTKQTAVEGALRLEKYLKQKNK